MKTILQVAAGFITMCIALSISGCGALLESEGVLSKFKREGFSCFGSRAESYSAIYSACYERVSNPLISIKPKYKKKIERNRITCSAFGPSSTIEGGDARDPEQRRAECSATVASENQPDSVLAKLKVDIDALAASDDRYWRAQNTGTVTYFDRHGQVVHTSSLTCQQMDGDGFVNEARDDKCPKSVEEL